MKLRYFMFFILIGLLFAASISGCSTASQVDVTETLSEAQTQLASGDLDGARESYESALAADPTNAESNFGAAMLGILNVAVDENTRTFASKFGVNMPTTLNELFNTTPTTSATAIINFSSFFQAATTPEITPGEVQSYMENTLIPALDTALNRLAVVESNSNFKYTITTDMSGGDSDIEVDLGEIYALDLLGSLIRGMLYEAVSYNWDYTTSDPLSEPNFGTLKSNGSANMANARSAYARAMEKWISGINYIANEADDQSDDAIPKFSNPSEKDEWLSYIGKVKNSLENGDTTIELNPTADIVVDLKQYYSSPISDLKTYVNAAKDNFTGFDFTINGAFPQMQTQADWENLYNSLR